MDDITSAGGNIALQAIGAALVRSLGGIWSGAGGMCRCPAHDDRTPSLSVRVGHSALLFKCFAGCSTGDVLRAVRRLYPAGVAPSPVSTRGTEPHRAATGERARLLWSRSVPIPGTAAERYLLGRGLTGPFTQLRFHARTPLAVRRGVTFRPAMIAAVRAGERIVAVQRTFLDSVAMGKARDLAPAHRMLGRPGTGAVRLAAAGAALGLAEGVETGLAAMQLLEIPVWTLLGTERSAIVKIPETVDRLVLLFDNDAAGRRGAARAIEAHARPGRVVETRWPPPGFNDWNDILLEEVEGAEGGRG